MYLTIIRPKLFGELSKISDLKISRNDCSDKQMLLYIVEIKLLKTESIEDHFLVAMVGLIFIDQRPTNVRFISQTTLEYTTLVVDCYEDIWELLKSLGLWLHERQHTKLLASIFANILNSLLSRAVTL